MMVEVHQGAFTEGCSSSGTEYLPLASGTIPSPPQRTSVETSGGASTALVRSQVQRYSEKSTPSRFGDEPSSIRSREVEEAVVLGGISDALPEYMP